ncbi:MAG TPA: SurA N-terminal domain-containing protein, partial [Chloroflexota bacterium]|nr:SurA N-terminal domain-containing protein [Chloroflexota bacterium]
NAKTRIYSGLAAFVLTSVMLLSGCATAAAGCSGNVAVVGGRGISQAKYARLLKYTTNFYQRVDQQSPYYHQVICGSTVSSACKHLKTQLRSRVVEQQLVDEYAQTHHLTPSAADWSRAMDQERILIQRSGGYSGFSAYLREIGMSQGQFLSIVRDQIETAKVQAKMGTSVRFQRWLRRQEHSTPIKLCPSRSR